MTFHKIQTIACSLIFILFLPVLLRAQDVNIIPYLKRIENGAADEVRLDLTNLKLENPNSPSVMFLEGVLTENGQKAIIIYQDILDDYPDSKYADAALYRIYTYYYALGLYESAKKKLSELTNNYPESPYIKIAKQNQLPVNPEITREKDITGKTDFTGDDSESEKIYNFTIQAGAFSVKENAENLKMNFQNSGMFSEIKTKLVAGTTFHIVYVGKFITENDAESFLKSINEKFKLAGRVITIAR